MSWYQNRRLWQIVGALAAVALVIGLYTWPALPSGLNWLVDLVAFATTFVSGLAIISQFVLPVQTMAERRHVFEHFLSFVFGSHGPNIFVKDGQKIARAGELEQYGEGVAVIDAASAIVLEQAAAARGWPRERGAPLVRAHGPGVCFIEPGERIVATLDLRRQSRGAPARALTRDGIEVSAHISVTFSLNPESDGARAGDDAPGERVKPAYAFNPHSAFLAVYGKALTEKQPVEWTDLPVLVAVEIFRNHLAEHTLDDLFRPTVANVFPFGEFQAAVAGAVKSAPVLRERGVVVHAVGIGRFSQPREVVNQRVRSWQARWQKATIQQTAAVDTQAFRTLVRWRKQAQIQIVNDLKAIIEITSGEQEKSALAMMLANVLQRAATDPVTRSLLPRDALRDLEALDSLLKLR